MGWLLLLFVAVPAVELALIVEVGRSIGLAGTLGLILLTGVAGASLARRAGLAVLARMQAELDAGRLPHAELLEAALVLLAGVLLLTPGFLTDAAGVLCLMPPTRRAILAVLRRALVRAMERGRVRVAFGGPTARGGPGGAPGGGAIKDAEYEVHEDRPPRPALPEDAR